MDVWCLGSTTVVARRQGRQRWLELWRSGGCLSQVLALTVVEGEDGVSDSWLRVDLWVLAVGG